MAAAVDGGGLAHFACLKCGCCSHHTVGFAARVVEAWFAALLMQKVQKGGFAGHTLSSCIVPVARQGACFVAVHLLEEQHCGGC